MGEIAEQFRQRDLFAEHFHALSGNSHLARIARSRACEPQTLEEWADIGLRADRSSVAKRGRQL